MNVENDTHPPLRLLIVPSGQIPSATDIRRLTARVGLRTTWSDAAIAQLLKTAAAAERWLTEYPEEAARLFEDPAAAVEEMRRSGFLTEPADELLHTLRELAEERKASGADALREAMGIRTTVSFGVKPALRSTPLYQAPHQTKPDERKR